MNRDDMLRFILDAPDTDLVDMIFIDPISGIQNRNAFNRITPDAVAIIDMDSLKWINDNLGHMAGDQQLRILGRVLQRAFGDDAYHLSGDEFAVVGNSGEYLRDRLEGLQHNMNFFSFGTGPNLNIADKNMQLDKKMRENDGTRAPRGEAPPLKVPLAK